VVVDRWLEQVEQSYHYSSAQGELIWRMDKHPGTGSCRTFTAPAVAMTPTGRSISPRFSRRSSSSWSEIASVSAQSSVTAVLAASLRLTAAHPGAGVPTEEAGGHPGFVG
jgi:hypothetical protein